MERETRTVRRRRLWSNISIEALSTSEEILQWPSGVLTTTPASTTPHGAFEHAVGDITHVSPKRDLSTHGVRKAFRRSSACASPAPAQQSARASLAQLGSDAPAYSPVNRPTLPPEERGTVRPRDKAWRAVQELRPTEPVRHGATTQPCMHTC